MKKIAALIIVLMFGGCASADLKDVPASIWGSTTRVLEKQRVNALTKTYDKGYWETLRTAVAVLNKKHLVVFKKDEVRGLMIVMGIPGAVNTTEVGVFFVEVNDQQTRVELSSLSTNAKRLLGKILFHNMDVAFGLAAPDRSEGFDISEFQNGMSPEFLVKTIQDDGFIVPAADTPLEALNVLLVDRVFYDHWRNKYRAFVLSKDMEEIVAVPYPDRTVEQIRELNRYLLQETYPTVCPKGVVKQVEPQAVVTPEPTVGKEPSALAETTAILNPPSGGEPAATVETPVPEAVVKSETETTTEAAVESAAEAKQ